MAAVGAVPGQQQSTASEAQCGERGVEVGHRHGPVFLPSGAVVGAGHPDVACVCVAQQGYGALRIEGEHGRLPCCVRRQAGLAEYPARWRQVKDFAPQAEQFQAGRQRQPAIGQRYGRRLHFAAEVGQRRGLQPSRLGPAPAAIGGKAVVDRTAQGPADVPQVQPAAFGMEDRLAEVADVGECAAGGALPAGDDPWFAPAVSVEDAEADDVFTIADSQPGSSQPAIGELGQRRVPGLAVTASWQFSGKLRRQSRSRRRWRAERERRRCRNAPDCGRQRQREQEKQGRAGGWQHGA